MQYAKIERAVFLERPNRFIAKVLLNKKEEIVHVKNTGRCQELLKKGVAVILEESNNPKRKTKYSLIAVYKKNCLVNIDSQAPNVVVAEGIAKGKIEEIGIVSNWKREVTFGNSRFDFYYEKGEKRGFLEVKGVTLEQDGLVLFPDAPTQRGTKHIKELIVAAQAGYEAAVLFLVQLKGSTGFSTNASTDLAFANAVEEASKEGVQILVYDCLVQEDSIVLDKAVKFIKEKEISLKNI